MKHIGGSLCQNTDFHLEEVKSKVESVGVAGQNLRSRAGLSCSQEDIISVFQSVNSVNNKNGNRCFSELADR